jgi:hypothetical protein
MSGDRVTSAFAGISRIFDSRRRLWRFPSTSPPILLPARYLPGDRNFRGSVTSRSATRSSTHAADALRRPSFAHASCKRLGLGAGSSGPDPACPTRPLLTFSRICSRSLAPGPRGPRQPPSHSCNPRGAAPRPTLERGGILRSPQWRTRSGAEGGSELERADQPFSLLSRGSREKLDRNWTVTPLRTT